MMQRLPGGHRGDASLTLGLGFSPGPREVE